MKIKIKGWKKFQHFKERRPPWIKVYREILEKKEWHRLTGDQAKALVMLWLLASENYGEIETDDIAFRLRIDEEKSKELCRDLSQWFEHDINAISSGYQDVPSETETERETETETTPDGDIPLDCLAMRKLCEMGYGWEPGEHKHKIQSQDKHAAYFEVAVAFMVRAGIDCVLKPDEFSTYVHSYFGNIDDPEDFFDLKSDKSLPKYAIARIGAATDADLGKYGTRLFEFFVKDFNRIYGMENDAAFKKARTEEIKRRNRIEARK